MILIADSGSTKTDWRLNDDKKQVHQFRTSGLNPYFLSSEEIAGKIQSELILPVSPDDIGEIFFYGAGCSSEEKCNEVERGMHKIFPKSKIVVQHDLLAACHALCGREEGIVAILGTGSNSCLYDGEKIVDQVPSLGFILGDEGSGTHIGKKILQSVYYRECPEHLAKRFNERFHLSKEDVLEAIYKKPLPNQYLASFTQFAFQNRNEPLISKMVYDSFTEFFDRHITKYNDYRKMKIHCTGSVGYNFADVLRRVAVEKGMQVGKITESPIAGLMLYHLGEQN